MATMKKTEMEAHAASYHRKTVEADAAEQAGRYSAALTLAEEAWPFIDGMMQFERKYLEKEFAGLRAIDLALYYAPLLLDVKRLDRLDELLKLNKRIDRNATDEIGEEVAAARTQLFENHRLWAHLQSGAGVLQSDLRDALGGDQGHWHRVVGSWERMGLVSRTPAGDTYRIDLVTRMDAEVPGKCPVCGAAGRAATSTLLKPLSCPKCRSRVTFVLLAGPQT